MERLHPLADELNGILDARNPAAYALLSEHGRAAYFPRAGILSQASDAEGKRYNATIGIALEDDRSPMRLDPVADALGIDPREALPYTSAHGKNALRLAWQRRIVGNVPSLGGARITLPVATAGLTHGLSIVGRLFLDRDQPLAIAAPYWDNYAMIFSEGNGAALEPFDLFRGNAFNLDGLRVALRGENGKRAVLLNFPNNPTGYAATHAETRAIVDAILESAGRGNRILAIVDDAYAGLSHDPAADGESLFGRLANLHGNVLAAKIDGPTKEDYAWGLRVGFVTYGMKGLDEASAKALEEKTAGVVRATVSSGSHLSQSLVLRALDDPRSETNRARNRAVLRGRYDETMRILRDTPSYADAFEPLPCNAGYFVCLRPREGIDPETVRQTLLRDYSTGVIATNGLLRVAFSSVPKADLPALFDNVFRACMHARASAPLGQHDAEKPVPVHR